MGKTECTQKQWRAVMGEPYVTDSSFSDSNYTKEGGERRVAPISWNEAQVFISALNELTGRSVPIAYHCGVEIRLSGR